MTTDLHIPRARPLGRPVLAVFAARSLDGFIATADGRLDWLENAAGNGENYGFDEFLASVDALAMGRATWDHIAALDPLPFGPRPVFVFTHRPATPRDGVTFWSLDPAGALEEFTSRGFDRVYVDGGRLVSSFLELDLIDEFTLFDVPVLLGTGRPLFHPVSTGPHPLRLSQSTSWPSGFVRRIYTRPRQVLCSPDLHPSC